jgi:opacity protein-like surface antigen
MKISYFERQDGAENVGAVARVFDMPSRARSVERAAAGPGPGRRIPAKELRGPVEAPERIEDIARRNVMRSLITIIAVAGATIITSLAGAAVASADESTASRLEVSVLGGIHALNKNDTSLPDKLLSVPAVAGVAYRITPTLAAEGELTWLIPIQQKVDIGSGPKQDRKAPNTLAYQVGLRGNLQVSSWTPYLAVGAGAMTFLSNSDADRLPRLDKSQTMFAASFGGGGEFAVNPHWGVRADFREFVAFPGDHATGFSSNGSADPIWMERGAVGLDYRF